jgi:hypothetical protein
MIRAVDFKPLDLSDEEFEYYLAIVKEFGDNCFQDTFETDEDTGYIMLVKPSPNSSVKLGIVFFLFNVMLNQRVREFDKLMMEFKKNNGAK